MTFQKKIMGLLVLVSVVPVAVSGIMSAQHSQEEIMERMEQAHLSSAQMVADDISNYLTKTQKSIALATEFIPFDQFPADQLDSAVWIPYRQFENLNAVTLLDSNGKPLCEVAHTTDMQKKAALGHETLLAEDVTTFLSHVPLAAALQSGGAIGEVYYAKDGSARLAMAISFVVKNGQTKWVLTAEVSLSPIAVKLAQIVPGRKGRTFVIDARGNAVLHSGMPGVQSEIPRVENTQIKKWMDMCKQGATSSTRRVDNMSWIGAVSKVRDTGWILVVEQPKNEALSSVRQTQYYTLLWGLLAIGLSIIGGMVLSREVSRPLTELSTAVRAIEKGDYSHHIDVRSNDEFGNLSTAFNRMTDELFAVIEQHERLFVSSIHTLVASVEAKDVYTRGHSERVTGFALQLCDEMGLTNEDREIAELAALLHDAGKIGVPETVLNKPGRLVDEEYKIIQTHPEMGGKIVHKIQHPDIEEVTALVRGHHERWDGTGYPDGLKGDDIPLIARVLSVVDAYDAMTSDRAYRKGMPVEDAISILEECAGSQFDPEIVAVFCKAAHNGKFNNVVHKKSRYTRSDVPSSPYLTDSTRKIRTSKDNIGSNPPIGDAQGELHKEFPSHNNKV